MKLILSIIENIIESLIIWKIGIPFFIELGKVIGGWAYFGLFSFILVIIIVEYASYKENKMAYFISKFLR